MDFGYARVSGTGQDLKQQVKELEQAGVPKDQIYAETFTGTTRDRPEWQKLYRQLRKGDTVYFTKVDRIGRTVRVAVDIVGDLLDKGVKVYILQMGGYIDNSTYAGKLMFNMLTIMAEFEHDIIVERLATGKAYAKKHNPNYREGRPKRRITNRYKRIYEYSLTHSIRETALTTGVSESTVKRIKRQIRESEKAND
ncbi:recombinase family protein [Limosilactobacillus mucosae]|uniref:Recombinase family protein n=1 Tax=Limosilactobacillus mucosae TaxID=97478 RepID=A0AAJ1HUE5_LIMMU|nr:recombinase family protein [Limosilactobacillus mucosae]MDC2829536.1 recombinase family protein [Limosilactobacillus mucosae]